MSTEQIGNVGWAAPRATQVRANGREISPDGEAHSAIQSTVVVLTDSVREARFILNNWHRVMAAASDRIEQLKEEANGETG